MLAYKPVETDSTSQNALYNEVKKLAKSHFNCKSIQFYKICFNFANN